MTDDERLVKAARRLSESLSPGDLDHVLERITAAAVELIPDVDYASITIQRADGTLHTAAPTDELLCELDAAQYELQEGPCYEAAVTTSHVTSQDLANDERFPKYGAVAAAAGIHSQAGIRLYDVPGSGQGALNLYSRRPGTLGELGSLGALFADKSSTAIAYAHELAGEREASRTRESVGKAVGVTMERYEFTDERAFAFLTRLAQHHGVPLPVVADAIVSASRTRGDG
ncbi:MAG TPA: GAF and ANTAR domain-containing protein [Marmoricola sp.]|nr:GAF and ANTAR domain-containing protein [Marmoricola sp.]